VDPVLEERKATLRLGLIGLGRHGARYARHSFQRDVQGVELRAVWRRDRRLGLEQAAMYGARFEESPEAVISAPDVDAVLIVVPVALHVGLALQVAAAKKPLLLEKPMAPNAEEGARIVAAFRAAEKPLMIAQTLRFDPLTSLLRDRAQELGELRGFRFEQRIEPRGLAWEEDPAMSAGGVVIQTGIHTFDALRFTTGRDVRVLNATTACVHWDRNEDHAIAVCAIDKLIGDVAMSKIGRSRHMRYVLFCEAGAVEADYIGRTLTVTKIRDREVIDVPEHMTVVKALDAFAKCVRDGAPNPVPGEDSLESLKIVDAAYRAARNAS
jgi:predicted dehydrogenase